jgi:hypothetical protein
LVRTHKKSPDFSGLWVDLEVLYTMVVPDPEFGKLEIIASVSCAILMLYS